MDPSIIIMIIVLLFSVVFHEVSHGMTALYLGDPTAKKMGRLTLNPISHIDPMMTVMLPLMLWMFTGMAFGGAKPVPVNPFNFKNPKRDMAITAAAGPLSNLVLIILSIILYKILVALGALSQMENFYRINAGELNFVENFFFYAVLINVILMIFNLFPIPPLDGSKILMGFLTNEQADKYESMSRYGIAILIGLLLLGNVFKFSLFATVINPFLHFFLEILFL